MKSYSLRALFAFVTLACVALATGRYWVARGFVDEYDSYGGYWVPQVASLLPILNAETRLNDRPCGVCAGELYQLFGHEFPGVFGQVQLGCLPKTYEIDPDGRRFEFTELDTASISVLTVFGWSNFDVRRRDDKVTITQRIF